jgi:hypothetical protein
VVVMRFMWPGQDSNLRATDYEFCVPRDPR